MIYLKNARFFDEDELKFKEGIIKIYEGKDGEIEFIGDDDLRVVSKKDIIDCKGKIVMRSFANAHHHIYSTLARGMPAPKKSPKNFHEILKYIWWNLDKKLTSEMIEASALFAAVDSLKNGVTFIVDHHSSPFAIEGSLEIIKNAFDKVGVSSSLCYEISNRDGERIVDKAFEETENFLKNNRGLIGLHASFTVGEDTLKRAVELAESFNTGIHIHTAEDEIDQKLTKEKYGMTVIERFENAGVLELEGTILAHCIHIDDRERRILNKHKSYIVQNAESNLNNAVGVFSSKGLNENIMIGTDGMHGDVLKSAKTAYLIGQKDDKLSISSAFNRLRRVNNYLKENKYLGNGKNNLIILNYKSPTEITDDNFLGHLFYGINSNDIETVISNGRLVVKEREILTVDEQEIIRYSKTMANELWKKLKM